MSNTSALKDKLKAGKNEVYDGYQKFASAQFYGKFLQFKFNF